jgi:hypothetical protein
MIQTVNNLIGFTKIPQDFNSFRIMQQSIGDVQTVVVNQNHDNHISDIQFEVSTFCTNGSFSSLFSFVG